jgi:CRP/FNR family transcriptional regulator
MKIAITDSEEYKKIRCVDCKLKSKPFQKLTDDQLNRVDQRRVELSFKKGELLCKQGTLSSHIIFIRHGFVKLFIEKDGESVVVGIAKPGTFVGAQAIIW